MAKDYTIKFTNKSSDKEASISILKNNTPPEITMDSENYLNIFEDLTALKITAKQDGEITTPDTTTTTTTTPDTTTTTTTIPPIPSKTTSVIITYNIDNNVTVKLGQTTETLTKGNSTKTVTYTGPEEHIRLDLTSTTNMCVIDQMNGTNVTSWGKDLTPGTTNTKITIISATLTTTSTPDTTPSVTSTTTTTTPTPSVTSTTTTTPAPIYGTSVTIKYNIDNDVTVKLGKTTETLTKGNSTKTVSYSGPEEHLELRLSSTTNMYVLNKIDGSNVKVWSTPITPNTHDTNITIISATLTTTSTPDTTPSVTSTTTTTTPKPTEPTITSTTTTTPNPPLSPAPVHITSKDGNPIEDINLTATIWYKGKQPDEQKTIQITSLPYNNSLTEGFAYDYLDTPLTIKFTFSKGILTVNKNNLFENVNSGQEITISEAKEFKYTLGPTTPNTNTTPDTTPSGTSTSTTTTTPNPKT